MNRDSTRRPEAKAETTRRRTERRTKADEARTINRAVKLMTNGYPG